MNDRCLIDKRSYSAYPHSHTHNFHQIVLAVQGCLDIQIEQEEGRADQETAAIISQGKEHRFASAEENNFLIIDLAPEHFPQIEAMPCFVPLNTGLKHYVQCLQYSFHNPIKPSLQGAMLQVLVDLLAQDYLPNKRLDKRIKVAKDFLDQHFAQPISFQDLSKKACISQRQLLALFKQQLGVTPRQYLLDKRMAHAKQLLEQSSLPIQIVAEQSGYQSLSAFSSRFTQHFGQSPKHFR